MINFGSNYLTIQFPNLNGAAGAVWDRNSNLAAFNVYAVAPEWSTQQCGIITFDVIGCLLQDNAYWKISFNLTVTNGIIHYLSTAFDWCMAEP